MVDRAFAENVSRNLRAIIGVEPHAACPGDVYAAIALTIRGLLLERWYETSRLIASTRAKEVCYLSAEFLIGRQLNHNLQALKLQETAVACARSLGFEMTEISGLEPEPALGNGGLGRLAACFLESLANLGIPARGYGIRYEYGLFKQSIVAGWQEERPDVWLEAGNLWEVERATSKVEIGYGGEVGSAGHVTERREWLPREMVHGIPYDTLIPGFANEGVALLRLWRAKSETALDLAMFHAGDYLRAESPRVQAETISRILYPSDSTPQGKELRLRQEYFLVACAVQDVIRLHHQRGLSLERLSDHVALQLNDTHPALAIPELMRVLVDIEGMPWDKSWELVTKTCGFTNHTLLPEALERWSRPLLGRLLPRHLEIILAINQRFLDSVAATYPGDDEKLARVSLVEEGPEQHIRMANLAAIGSHSINGVAELHSSLVCEELFPDLYELFPERFQNKTNGVAHRRWMLLANPRLSSLITGTIGTRWISDAEHLQELENFLEDEEFRYRWMVAKRENKRDLASVIHAACGIEVNPESIFDVQAKRFHEYKRQLLKILHVVALYIGIKDGSITEMTPRTVIFSGKAAPGYWFAKLIIKLINSVAEVVNHDAAVSDVLRVAFLPDFSVTLAEKIYAGADVSEQISTAGKEASGTGNMKFALNGAVTVGTLDGANIEIRAAVGPENFFLFGHTVASLRALRQEGYCPRTYISRNLTLAKTLAMLVEGDISGGDQRLFEPLVSRLLYNDEYFVVADFESYVAIQEEVEAAYGEQERWLRASICNVARSGQFSSDRAIRQYAEEIWGVKELSFGGLERQPRPNEPSAPVAYKHQEDV